MKPTEERVSMVGAWPEPLEGNSGLQLMYTAGAMTRSIPDLKLWLSLVEGVDDRSRAVPLALLEEKDRPLKNYRIAWTDDFGDVPASSETRVMLEQVAKMLIDEQSIVEKHNPPNFDFSAALKTVGSLIGAWVSTRPTPKRPTFGNDLRRLISGGPTIRSILKGTRFNLKQYGAALVQRDRFTAQLEQFLSQWDVWICPTVAFPAFSHQSVGKSFESDGQSINYLLGGVNYTGLFTLTGHPVVVVPVGQTQAGLPIAIQIVGQRWKDRSLLAFAQKLTDLLGPWQRPSGY